MKGTCLSDLLFCVLILLGLGWCVLMMWHGL